MRKERDGKECNQRSCDTAPILPLPMPHKLSAFLALNLSRSIFPKGKPAKKASRRRCRWQEHGG